MKKSKRLLVALALAVVLAIAIVEPAVAATSAKQVGKNLGDTLKTWGTALFGGITAVVACKHLLNREVAQGMVFAVMAVVLGLFVFSQTGVGHFIQGLGTDLFG
jgi:hypothetical protein